MRSPRLQRRDGRLVQAGADLSNHRVRKGAVHAPVPLFASTQAMTRARYRAYRRARRGIDACGPVLGERERTLLTEMAEGLLLARAHESDEADELRHSAAYALTALVGQGLLEDAEADQIWAALDGAGPRENGHAPAATRPSAHRSRRPAPRGSSAA